MGYQLSKSKRIQAAIVLAIAALLVMTGTFAWYSFNQRRVNVFNLVSMPNVNLHDDFAGGPEKDVYVENSGVQPALVRVRLTELLNQNGVLLPEVATDDETAADWHIHTPSEVCEVCDFAAHEYFKWTMDGHKFYMPAPESAKGSQIDDVAIEPLAVGDLDAVIDYAKLLRAAFAGDSLLLSYVDEYLGGDTTHAAELQTGIKAIPDDNTVSGVRQYDGQPDDELVRKLNEVRLTLIPTQIITMQDWLDGTTYSEPCKTGNFWVMDADGWCYWANALKAGEATGQLLSNVENIKQTSGELIYKINVALNATTFADTELNEFFRTAQANGGIGEDGMHLMLMASGGYVMGGDGELYADIGGGVYRSVEKNNGSYVDHTLGDAIYAGADGIPGNGDDLKAGDAFSLGEDGGMTDGGDYTIEGFTVGENGIVYFHVGDGVYIVAVDENGKPDKDGTRYAPVSAGTDGTIGTADDESIESRYFYHIGNGVYIEVETKGATEPKSEPVTYYFAGMEKIIENQTENPDHPRYEVNNVKDANVQDKINAVFPLQLTVGDGFDVILAPDGDGGYYIDKIISGGTEYVMQELDEDENGDLRILLGDDGFIGVDSETGVLGGGMGEAGGTSGGVFVLPKPTGKGTQENPFLIRTRADMDWVSAQTLLGNVTAATYYKIADDVTALDMTTSDFTPIGNDTTQFSGHFDGNNKTIINLTVNRSTDYVGLFGFIEESGKVQDLTLENVSLTGNQSVGGVAGLCKGQITNVTILSGNITGTAFVGGIIGSNYQSFTASVANCTNHAAVTGTSTSNNHVGGIAGFINDGEIIDCVNNGEVRNSGVNTGGIVGYTYKGTVSGSSNTGNVISSGDLTGGIAGRNGETIANSALVTDCTNSGTVTGINQIGGILGSNLGTIIDCANIGTVTGNAGVGGVAGNNNGTVQTSYSTGDISGITHCIGGVVGEHKTGTVTNCYAWGNVTSTNGGASGGVIGAARVGTTVSYVYHSGGVVTGLDYGAGGVVGQNEGTVSYAVALASQVKRSGVGGSFVGFGRVVGRNTGTATNVYANSSMTITPEGSHVAGTNCDASPTQDWWSGTAKLNFTNIWSWDSGAGLPVLTGEMPDGSPENPYLIRTRADLEWLSATVSGGEAFAGKYFKMANDIDMGAAAFTPIGSYENQFTGHFDGNNQTINNLKITGGDSVALFGYIGQGGVVEKVTLSNASISGNKTVGGIVGINGGKVSYCVVNATVIGTNNQIGGIVGFNGGVIENCVTSGSITGLQYAGGIAGSSHGNILDSSSSCTVNGTSYVGGIAGDSANSSVIDCANTGNVTGTGNNVGGVVGSMNPTSTVTGCSNSGIATGNANVGGIAGYNNGTVSGCTNTGTPAAQVGAGNAVQ